MKTIISANNLIKSYGSIKAVDGLSLEIAQGEFFGFLGPNGAGKTTTIRMLTGIIEPNSGKITIAGNAYPNLKPILNMIGVVPESRGFYDWMTAKEYLLFFANLYGISNPHKKIDELLEKVNLSDRKNSTIGTFSRGMKQRLGVARALVNDPKILFLDEPTLGLDPQGQEEIQNLLKQLNKSGVTIFLSSHQLNEVSNLCSRVAIINKGRLVVQGTIAELQKKTNLAGSLKDIFLALTNNNHV
ncbi:MAG: ABC transporter ATP-binding protein [Candidatus Omnitrophica bacterium]|nr:ABC transporter ATP-binding protein [Candidatus Omnitrophota bacterium]